MLDELMQVRRGRGYETAASLEKARVALQAGRFYATWLPQLAVGEGQKPRGYDEFGDLAEHLRFVERSARKLARSTFYATTIREERPDRAAEAAELADLFCRHARRRIGNLFGALWSNDDVESYALAQRVLEGRYAFLEDGIADPSGDGTAVPPLPA